MKLLTALFFAASLSAAAQPYQVPQVPHKMEFAGITLTIRDDAQREIQKDVNALWQSPKHFNIKAERAKTYFPIIEKIFAEERVPDDFKYLVLQESALIPDAVSVSNAVGFWQFKDFTAMEMGLRVDDLVDERMNIFSATRGAAKYIKRNNYQFNNWVYALQAYQMGAGGVARSVKDVESGARHMIISSSTYWYVKKFLAHKVAFQNSVTGKPQQSFSTYENRKQQSVEEAAASFSLPADQLLSFNKWIRKGVIPEDRMYAMLVPLTGGDVPQELSVKSTVTESIPTVKNPVSQKIVINGVPAILATAGETLTTLAIRAGISLPLFMSYNDLAGFEKVVTGNFYFTERKKAKAEKEQVLAKTGDDLWSISQQYGVTLSKLKKYNRTNITTLQAGQVVWLSSKMPKNQNTNLDKAPLITDEKYFTWGEQPDDTTTLSVSLQPEMVIEKFTAPQQNLHVINSDTEVVEMDKSTIAPLPNFHTVQAGENLYAISKKYGISLTELARWNNLGNNYNLSHGQQLNLHENQSVNKPAKPVEITHQVKPSDTLYGIAREYGITIKEIMEWNNKSDFVVSAGEILRILKE